MSSSSSALIASLPFRAKLNATEPLAAHLAILLEGGRHHLDRAVLIVREHVDDEADAVGVALVGELGAAFAVSVSIARLIFLLTTSLARLTNFKGDADHRRELPVDRRISSPEALTAMTTFLPMYEAFLASVTNKTKGVRRGLSVLW